MRESEDILTGRSLTPNGKGELELACYLCAAPAGPQDEELTRVAGARRAAGECFQSAKNEVAASFVAAAVATAAWANRRWKDKHGHRPED